MADWRRDYHFDSAAAVLAADAQQFRAGVALVRLPVVVAGRDGLLVRGLKPEVFEIKEDGVQQTIAAFAEGDPGQAIPLHLGLLLDASASMEKDIRAAANAAVQFVTAMDEAADVTFVDFDSAIRIGRFEPNSYERLFERIRSPKADGMTALWDAIASYVRGTAGREGQHVLLMYTDGGDSASRTNFTDLLKLLRQDNVVLYALGYLENSSGTSRVVAESNLRSLAQETGGDAFFPSTIKDLTRAYARILDEIGSRYTIGYVSSNEKPDGKYRKVQVRLTAPVYQSAKVRTRPGYLPLSAR